MNIKKLKSSSIDFYSELKSLLSFDDIDNNEIIATTQRIVNDVRKYGDKALLDYSNATIIIK